MHPTPLHDAFHVRHAGARVMPGVMSPLRMSPDPGTRAARRAARRPELTARRGGRSARGLKECVGVEKPRTEIEASYDSVAEAFADEFYGELARKPFDRELLDRFAESVRARGRVCEIGCGPGQIARYLKDRGVQMCGLDLSREMVGCARRL